MKYNTFNPYGAAWTKKVLREHYDIELEAIQNLEYPIKPPKWKIKRIKSQKKQINNETEDSKEKSPEIPERDIKTSIGKRESMTAKYDRKSRSQPINGESHRKRINKSALTVLFNQVFNFVCIFNTIGNRSNKIPQYKRR